MSEQTKDIIIIVALIGLIIVLMIMRAMEDD